MRLISVRGPFVIAAPAMLLALVASCAPGASPLSHPSPASSTVALDGGTSECISGAHLRITLPMGWRNDGPPALIGEVELAQLPDKEENSARWFNELVAAGEVRILAVGQIPDRASSKAIDGSLLVYERIGDSSQAAAVDETVGQGFDAYGTRTPTAREQRTILGRTATALSYDGVGIDGRGYLEDVTVFWRSERQTLVIALSATVGGNGRELVAPLAKDILASLEEADCP